MRVAALWRHPIKGHGVEAVDAVDLAAGRTMPWDRVWAIAHEAARVSPGAWAPCQNFARGAKSPELMAIRAEVDEARGRVRLTHPRAGAIEVDPDDPGDAARLVAWVTPLTAHGRALPARVVRADIGMTDSDFPSVSVLNRASLDALGERLGMELAMERFRGNVWLEGLAPFEEFALVGRKLRVGGAVLAVREPITRCVATGVDPATGVSNADTLGALEAGWGHRDFGAYGEVVEGGRVAVGDAAVVL
ncbi:MAG: MOSC domain-containing protein [Amaricoccus sp.]